MSRKMKKFLKNLSILITQPLFGEVWLVFIGATLLFIFGVIDFNTLKEWLVVAFVFGVFLIISVFIIMFFRKILKR